MDWKSRPTRSLLELLSASISKRRDRLNEGRRPNLRCWLETLVLHATLCPENKVICRHVRRVEPLTMAEQILIETAATASLSICPGILSGSISTIE